MPLAPYIRTYEQRGADRARYGAYLLEAALLDNLHAFLMELGHDFC